MRIGDGAESDSATKRKVVATTVSRLLKAGPFRDWRSGNLAYLCEASMSRYVEERVTNTRKQSCPYYPGVGTSPCADSFCVISRLYRHRSKREMILFSQLFSIVRDLKICTPSYQFELQNICQTRLFRIYAPHAFRHRADREGAALVGAEQVRGSPFFSPRQRTG